MFEWLGKGHHHCMSAIVLYSSSLFLDKSIIISTHIALFSLPLFQDRVGRGG